MVHVVGLGVIKGYIVCIYYIVLAYIRGYEIVAYAWHRNRRIVKNVSHSPVCRV